MNGKLKLLDEIFDIESYLNEECDESNNNSEIEKKPPFKVTNDKTAEWIIRKIKEELAEQERQINVIKFMISEYKFKQETIEQKYNNKIARLNEFLKEYFEMLNPKITKTQKTYALPSGKLIQKINRKEYKITDGVLLKYLKDNKMNTYIEVKESPKWGELKKVVSISKDGTKVIDEDGVIFDGVEVIPKPDEFEVKLEK